MLIQKKTKQKKNNMYIWQIEVKIVPKNIKLYNDADQQV